MERKKKNGGTNKESLKNKTGHRRGKSQSSDTPEVIAAKRVARKAKRDKIALESEVMDIRKAVDS